MQNVISISAIAGKSHVPTTGTLEEKLVATFRAFRETNGPGWMCRNDDEQFRSAVGAVMLACPEEQDRLTLSMKPLQALSAMMNGVPVDVGEALNFQQQEGFIPLLKLWHDSRNG